MTTQEQIDSSIPIVVKHMTRCRWCGKAIDRQDTALWLPKENMPWVKRRCTHMPGRCRTADWTFTD